MNSILREFDEGEYRRMLAEQSRTEDIIRSADDKEYQKKLFGEYGI